MELEVYIVVAACVFHNFCLLHDDFDDMYMHDLADDDDDDRDGHHHHADGRAEAKRAHLMHVLETDTKNSVTMLKFNSTGTLIYHYKENTK